MWSKFILNKKMLFGKGDTIFQYNHPIKPTAWDDKTSVAHSIRFVYLIFISFLPIATFPKRDATADVVVVWSERDHWLGGARLPSFFFWAIFIFWRWPHVTGLDRCDHMGKDIQIKKKLYKKAKVRKVGCLRYNAVAVVWYERMRSARLSDFLLECFVFLEQRRKKTRPVRIVRSKKLLILPTAAACLLTAPNATVLAVAFFCFVLFTPRARRWIYFLHKQNQHDIRKGEKVFN